MWVGHSSLKFDDNFSDMTEIPKVRESNGKEKITFVFKDAVLTK